VKTGRFKLRYFKYLIFLDIFTFIAGLAYAETTTLFSVTTTDATAITASSAELHGTINPGGSPAAAWFEWGATTSFGNRTETRLAGDGTAAVNVSQSTGIFNHTRLITSVLSATGHQQDPPVFLVRHTHLRQRATPQIRAVRR
jgi:hypothetical protein